MLNHLPLATGPYVPGVIDVMVDYVKESPFIRLYYPTDEKLDLQDQSKRWIPWMPDDSYMEGISKVLLLYKFVLKIAFWWSDNIKIPALYGSKPRTTEPLRCIVMSHGLGGSRFLYSNICCELASRGFLVAALEHRDLSACNTYYYASKSDAESDTRTTIEFKHVKLDNIKIPALYGSKPRTTEPLRCIVMSHGLGGSRFLYSNICCELASRGFLVAALEHRDLSACNTYYYASKSDAESDTRTTIEFKHVKLGKDHYRRRNEQIKIKSGECSKVVDFLVNLQKGVVPHNIIDDVPFHKERDMEFKLDYLVGKLDLDTMCMMGHSFGAATALYTLCKRPEFKTGILLDPWMFPVKNESLEEKISKPLLFINTQTFHITANVEAMSKLMHVEGAKMYTIKHTTHENQTDTVLLVGYWLNWFMKKLDPWLALRINNSLIVKFLHEHINYPTDIKDCDTFLAGEQKDIEEGLTKPWA